MLAKGCLKGDKDLHFQDTAIAFFSVAVCHVNFMD